MVDFPLRTDVPRGTWVSRDFEPAYNSSDFVNYFLAFPSGFPKGANSKDEKSAASAGREGILELCWNHGTGEITNPSFPPAFANMVENTADSGHRERRELQVRIR